MGTTSDLLTPADPSADQVPTWDVLVRDHSAKVYRLAYRLTGNRQDAEDLTQDTFVRAFRALPNYQPGNLDGWLYRITTNIFLDNVRRRRRIRFEDLPEYADDRMAGSEPGPERLYEFRNLEPDIASALARLSPPMRAAVVLCDLEDYTYEEVAQTLGIRLGTVRSRIHRGRAQLRQLLEHRMPRPQLAVV